MDIIRWTNWKMAQPTEKDYPIEAYWSPPANISGARGANTVFVPQQVPFQPGASSLATHNLYWAPYVEPLPPKSQAEFDRDALNTFISQNKRANMTEIWLGACAYARK